MSSPEPILQSALCVGAGILSKGNRQIAKIDWKWGQVPPPPKKVSNVAVEGWRMQTRGTSSFGLNSTLSSRCSVVKQGRTWPGLKLGAHWISDKSAYLFFVVSVDKRWRNLHVLQACTDFFFLYVAQTYTVDIENITLKMQTHRALLVQCPNLLRHFPSSFPNAIFHALTSLLLFLPTLCRTFNQRPSSILTPIADH